MKKKLDFKLATVTSTSTITPNMQRITLQAPEFADFPENCEGGYIKLLFNKQGGTEVDEMPSLEDKPTLRTYTIRRFLPQEQSIEVDFVRHETEDTNAGFASRWAQAANVGDTIYIGGPGIIQEMSTKGDWYFMVADMTSLPALSAKIKRLPADACGYAVISITSELDKQTLQAPDNLKVIWLTNGESLPQSVINQPWLPGSANVWCACEFESMKALRQYFRNEKQVDRENIYISSYWKQGVSEDGHKVLKKQDLNAQ